MKTLGGLQEPHAAACGDKQSFSFKFWLMPHQKSYMYLDHDG